MLFLDTPPNNGGDTDITEITGSLKRTEKSVQSV